MTKTLVEQLEEGFEPPETARQVEPKTLAEYVSGQLMQNGLPRLSPELFELTREAQVTLSEKQREQIDSFFREAIETGNEATFCRIHYSSGVNKFNPTNGERTTQREWHERDAKGEGIYSVASRKCLAEIPRFFYGLAGEDVVVIKNSAGVQYNSKHNSLVLDCGVFGQRFFNIEESWKAPFSLNVNATVPEIPKGFIELGDEAIAEYYDAVRMTQSGLRRTTGLVAPRIGVLWAPIDESLYCTGEIPELVPFTPERLPLPLHHVRDPALILDIPDGEKSYRHVVAVWDIGQELPFRNWLAEYSEGRRK